MRLTPIALLALAACGGAPRPTCGDYIAEGDRLAAAGDKSGALSKYSAAITLSDRADVRKKRAAMALATGRYDLAIEDCDAALRARPWDAEAERCRGQVLMKTGRHEEAAAGFRRACERDPANAVCWAELGQVYVKLGKFDEAIEAFEKAVRLAPMEKQYEDWLIAARKRQP